MLILKVDNAAVRSSITFFTGFVGCAVMGSLWTFTGLTFARTRGLALGVLTTWSYAIASLSPITIGWIGDHYRVSTGLLVICVPVVFLACATFAVTALVKKR
jgi:MFS family permease